LAWPYLISLTESMFQLHQELFCGLPEIWHTVTVQLDP
jgi:hypothetical protein